MTKNELAAFAREQISASRRARREAQETLREIRRRRRASERRGDRARRVLREAGVLK